MFRTLSRCAIAVAVVLGLLAFAPAAQASPLGLGEVSIGLDLSWLDAALSWLQGLLPGAGARPLEQAAMAGSKDNDTTGFTVTPMTGSCIDPQGFPSPWCEY